MARMALRLDWPLTTVKVAMPQPSPQRGEGAEGWRGFKSSTHRCFAGKRLCRGGGVPQRGPKGRSGLYPTLCRELLRPFSLGYFSFTPSILPSALRAGFAVRTRSCACVGQQKKSDSSLGRGSKRPLRKRHPGVNATTKTKVAGSQPLRWDDGEGKCQTSLLIR
jgi:hypothetical protein